MNEKTVRDAGGGPSALTEDLRTGLDAGTLRRAILDNLTYVQAVFPSLATRNDWYMALAHTVRDRLLHRWARTVQTYSERDVKVVAYLSAEFLTGPHLGNNLAQLGIEEAARQAVTELGLDLGALLEQEEEPGLGNGGLGRLAACFLDSLATLEIPAIGYGIRYEFGLFDQEIRDGWQVEVTDKWLRYGNPWEIARPELACDVKLGGHTEPYLDEQRRYRVRWVPERVVKGIPYDTPIPGYRVGTCNTLRLWRAEACESFDVQAFNVGDYYRAVDEKIVSETITKVLYPNDEPDIGKRLRLAQQYFFVSCSLRDMLRILDIRGAPVERLAGAVRGPAQRHPSLDRGRGAHAPARGRAPARLGGGVGDHAADLRLHQPHAAARGAGDVAVVAVRLAAAAPPRDRLRDQPALPRRRPRPVSGRRCPRGPAVAHRRARREARPHGASRLRGQPRDQRRVGAPHGPAAAERAARLRRPLAGALQQQDERRDAAALPRAGQSRAERAAHRAPRRRLGDGAGPAAATRAAGRRRRLPAPLAAGEAPEQGTPRSPRGVGDRRRDRPRLALRRPGEAHPRVQAPASERAAHHHPAISG